MPRLLRRSLVSGISELLGGIELLGRDGLDRMESQRPTEAPIELDAAQAGHERPDGEDPRKSPGNGDGELLDILIQQFIITVL